MTGLSRSTTGVSSTERVDNALAADSPTAHAGAMSNVDGCPECVLNTEVPYLVSRVGDGWRCAYRCSDCGHAWTTDWRD